MEFKRAIDASFKINLAKGKKVLASNTRTGQAFLAKNLTDGNTRTYWATNDRVKTATLTIDFGKTTELNRMVLQEYIALGQRIKSFSVEYLDGKGFKPLLQQTTIGHKRILSFANIKTTKIRINVLEANACPVLSEVAVYKAPDL
ncbi:F5/8 type C domain protein [compost metagenome]